MELINLTIQAGRPISEALHVITREASGVCFVVQGLKLIGVITDGDIRRAFLIGVKVDDPVDLAMKKNYFSLPVHATLTEIQKNIALYKNIPILNKDGDIVDVATLSRYHQIPLIQPALDGNELEYVTDCILTGWISSQGKYVKDFESNFSKYIGVDEAIAVSNGTVALHLALIGLGIGPGDEVLVPDLTFAATINAVIYTGATPVLVDVDPISMAMNLTHAEKLITKNTRAVLIVHLYGYPADMESLSALSESHNLLIIEDCAEALGSCYKGRHVGTFGHAATFSFFGNKTITTGEGGMVLFKDPGQHIAAKILRDHGMSQNKRYWHDKVGFNYRMTNLQAAIGVAQLERIEYFIGQKRWIAERYNAILKTFLPASLPKDGGDVYNSYWLYTVVLNPELASVRNKVLQLLTMSGIEARPVFFPLHRMPPYAKFNAHPASYPASDFLSDCGISLPSSVTLTELEIIRTCESLKGAMQRALES